MPSSPNRGVLVGIAGILVPLIALVAGLFGLGGPQGVMNWVFNTQTVQHNPHLTSYAVPSVSDFDPASLSARGKPCLLMNTVAHRWPALKRWDLRAITAAVPHLTNVKAASDGMFTYIESDKPWSLAKSPSHSSNARTFQSLPTACVLGVRSASRDGAGDGGEVDCSPADGLKLYKSLKITDMGPLAADINMVSPFLLGGQTPSVHVWFGSVGATATTHYDTEHNIFVQIAGRKRFVLIPPSSHTRLHLYPFHHPSWRQAQVKNPQDGPSDVFPLATNLSAYDVILQAGDVLYVPPMWFHFVQAVEEPSVSVNIWSESHEYEAFTNLQNHKLPFDPTWPPGVLAAVTRSYCLSVLNALFGKTIGAQGFLERMLSNRFGPLFAYTFGVATDNPHDPHAEPSVDRTNETDSVPHPFTFAPPPSAWLDALETKEAVLTRQELGSDGESRQELFKAAKFTASQLASLPLGAREIMAEDHIQQLCAFVVRVARSQSSSASNVDGSTKQPGYHLEYDIDPRDLGAQVVVSESDETMPTPLELVVFIRDVLLSAEWPIDPPSAQADTASAHPFTGSQGEQSTSLKSEAM